MKQPTPKQIKAARHKAGLTQTQAGQVVGLAMRTWQDYEAGKRTMLPVVWWAWHERIKRQ